MTTKADLSKTAILLLNIGTPASYETADVQSYLTEFLSDKEVVNIPFFIRLPLVRFWIAPRRAPFSAEKYHKIWTQEGSPLLVHSQNLAAKLSEQLKTNVWVAMRYGRPSIAEALEQARQKSCEQLILVPMYPQYARATTESSLQAVYSSLKKMKWGIQPFVVKEFYEDPEFIRACLNVEGATKTSDHVLFSFHGLPVSQLKKDPECQLNSACCQKQSSCQRRCYRAQSYATARALAQQMGLDSNQWSVSFQSRLGPVRWIEPYTDQEVVRLAKSGVQHLKVFCPSFVADCLETLEEIGMEMRQLFLENGGKSFHLVPCVNDSQVEWVENLVQKSFNP